MLWWIRADDPKELRKQQLLASVGIELALSPVVGWGLGLLIDRWLETTPWASMLGLGVGVLAGFRALYDAARKVRAELEEAPEARDDRALTIPSPLLAKMRVADLPERSSTGEVP